MTMSDRIAVMDGGRIVQIGAPQDVYYRPADALRRRVLRRNQPVAPAMCLRLGRANYAMVALDGAVRPGLASSAGAAWPQGPIVGTSRGAVTTAGADQVDFRQVRPWILPGGLRPSPGKTFLGRHFRDAGRDGAPAPCRAVERPGADAGPRRPAMPDQARLDAGRRPDACA